MRGNSLRRHHVLRDALPHGTHRMHFVIAEVHFFARHCRFERHVHLPARNSGCGCRWWRRWPRRYRRSRGGVSRRSSWSASGRNGGLDVLFADSPTRPGTLNSGEVDAVLLGHAPHQRRTMNPLGCGTRGSGCNCGRNRRRSRRPRRRWGRSSGGGDLCRRGRSRLRWRGGRGRRRNCEARRIDDAHNGLNRHSLSFADLDLLQHARRRRRNFGVHLVRGNFKQGLVALHLVAGLLQPLGDRAFENTLAHLGHYYIYGHDRSPVLVKNLVPRQLLRGRKNLSCVRQKILFQRRRVGHRRIQRSDAHQRTVQVVKRFLE